MFEIVLHLIVCHNTFVLGLVIRLSNAQVFYYIHLVCAMQALKEKDFQLDLHTSETLSLFQVALLLNTIV